jgi:NAD(P)-dependent dehydrogenase (short-subunit alcohol dehydrogenase family)
MSISLVTGANRGLGFATARALAQAGGSVILTSRDKGQAETSAAGLRAEGLDVVALSLDVTSPTSITAAVDQVRRDHGHLDVLVTISLAKKLADTEIKVTSVCPGFVQTDLTPINREQAPVTAEQAADIVVTAATLPADADSGTFIDKDGPVAW